MIRDLGNAPDAAYLGDDRWPKVLEQAAAALTAMVRADALA
jgi:hypothetical protein